MRIVFMGTPQFSVPILEALIEKHEVLLVVTQPDKRVGRHKDLSFSPVKEVALKHGISCFQPVNIKEDYTPVLAAEADIIITAAYGQIIPKILLEAPKYKAINVHASLLPKYRGGAPIHKAIINGEFKTGISIMYMALKMDAGDIICQEEIKIGHDNTTILTEKLSLLGRDLLLKTLNNIDNIKAIKQDESQATFAYNITSEEEKLNFNMKAKEVYNQIRGLALIPGAYATYNGKKVKIYEAGYDDVILGEVGQIVIFERGVLGIQALDGIIYPSIIQLEGKKQMSIKDFFNGSSTYFKKNDKMV